MYHLEERGKYNQFQQKIENDTKLKDEIVKRCNIFVKIKHSF